MNIYYYLTVFPMEALIASQLDPTSFGSYMATGTKKGSAEKLIFIEVEQFQSDFFDWEYAAQRCMPHQNGDPKASVYLSVYRTLEHTPLTVLKSLFLTTQDGRTLELPRCKYTPPVHERKYFIYKELCPLNLLVVSSLDPLQFPQFLTTGESKVWVPKLIFTDLKQALFKDSDYTGHIGLCLRGKKEHFEECLREIVTTPAKPNKILDRSHLESFSYQVIENGLYIGDGEHLVFYKMKSEAELRSDHRDWAKSAMII